MLIQSFASHFTMKALFTAAILLLLAAKLCHTDGKINMLHVNGICLYSLTRAGLNTYETSN